MKVSRLLSTRSALISTLSKSIHRSRHLVQPPFRIPASRRYVSRYVKSTPLTRIQEQFEKAKQDIPILLPILTVFTTLSVLALGIVIYDDYTRISPQYKAYPKAVEQQLRMALHNTYMSPDPDAASKHFSEAIKLADEFGMDPFSKESMGIRIRYTAMLEQFGYAKAAVDVLNEISRDCEKKLAELDLQQPMSIEAETTETPITRKTLLRWIIESKTKASSLCESDYIQNSTLAKELLSDAVALLVKETRDPQTNGFTDDNAAGLSMIEIASILSQMGDLYATSGEEANAVQVYMLSLQPLRAACNGTKSCKEVQLLSNIASTMDLAMKKPNAKINGRPPTKSSLEAARQATLRWADQAIATADRVPPDARDEICELALLSAQMTRADLLLDGGDKQTAKESFISLLPILREKGLQTLVNVAEQGLRRTNS